MNCPKCSAPNADGAKFCASCGAAMTTASPPPGGGAGMPEFAKKIITPGLIARVKAIILTPAQEWLAIEAEETSRVRDLHPICRPARGHRRHLPASSAAP